MVPNRLEEDFRYKLEQRTIQPSEMAWDRLDAMLSVTETKKQPKNRAWLYMAACFLAFLLVGSLLLTQENIDTPATPGSGNAVVNTGKSAPAKGASNDVKGEKLQNGMGSVPVSAQTEAVAVEDESTPGKATGKYERNFGRKPNTAASKDEKQDALATIQKADVNPAPEPEKLLAATVGDDISKKKSSVKVNHNSLLNSVEGELNEGFKSKMLESVVKNYNTVKTSVANRNYQ